MQSTDKLLYSILISILGFYVLGYLFPETFWTTHFLELNKFWLQGILLLPIGVLGYFFFTVKYVESKLSFSLRLPLIFLVSVGIALIFYCLAMKVDYYGDAYKFNRFHDTIPKVIPEDTLHKLLNVKLGAWTGEETILALVTYLAYVLKITYNQAFLIFDAFFGGVFVFIWGIAIEKFIKHFYWKLSLAILGLTAPFLLVFMGHIEIYAPVITMTLSWCVLLLFYIKEERKSTLILLVVLFLINLKLHTVSVLFLPALLLIFIKRIKGDYLNWKRVSQYILIPVFLAGAVLYFFVFKDHVDTRSIQTHIMAFEHLFLPLFSPDAPLDQYDLLSINHVRDYLLLLFLWSPSALLILLLAVFGYRKHIDWQAPEIVVLGVSLILFVAFFFVINPLLSMPIDWDLFCLPAPILLCFTLIIAIQLQEQQINVKKVFLAVSMLGILSISSFTMHQSRAAISLRLEYISKHIYHTYYEWTIQVFENAMKAVRDENHIERHLQYLEELKPYAEKGRDYEYSYLLTDLGLYYLRDCNEPRKALAYFDQAQEYFYTLNVEKLKVEAYLLSGQVEKAFLFATKLVQEKYPDEQRALRIGIHAGAEALKLKEIDGYCKMYLSRWPNDPLIREVQRRLDARENVREIKFLFQRQY